MSAILRVEHLHKEYPGVVAVSDVSFSLERGEVLALMGENGAGKSTVSKMISGAERPDSGTIWVDGNRVSFNSTHDAMRSGINMVHQELSMLGEMSVAENIFVNRQPTNRLGNVKWRQLYADAVELLQNFRLELDPKQPVKELSTGTQQLLEILRVTSTDSKLIILDEPTSSLSEDQVQLLFENIRRLKREGYAFIYITHKMDEIFAIADRVLVMRDGCYIGEDRAENLSMNQIVAMMVGREIKNLYGDEIRERHISEKPLLEVEGLTAPGVYEDIHLNARRGEIVGVAGLIGAGRTEMALGIFGQHRRKGVIRMNGQEVSIRTPADAIKNGIAYLTEDRKKLGLYLSYPIMTNLVATRLKDFSRHGLMQPRAIAKYAEQQVKDFRVSTPSVRQLIGNLSGGNQQKCLLAEWLGMDPEVLIIDEPTRGVDVGAKAEIYNMLKNHADSGHAVVVISSELPELIGICDRVYVMCEGRITGCLERSELTENRIMNLATGIDKMEVCNTQ